MSEEIKNIEETETVSVEKKAQFIADDPEKSGFQRNIRFKRKVCRFCHDKNAVIDYKDVKLMEQFITDRGKILPRRVTGTCAKHQRGVAQAIKRARILALIPFVEK